MAQVSSNHRVALALLALVVGSARVGQAQKIGADSKGQSVFTYYSTAARIELGSDDELAAGVTPWHRPIHKIRTPKSGRPVVPTVDKSVGITARLAALNAEDNIVLSDLLSTKLGVEGRIGLQTSIDQVYTLKDLRGTYTMGGTFIYGFDNFLLYNKSDSSVTHERPRTIGGEFNYTYFSPDIEVHRDGGKTRFFRWVFATSASLKKTWNDDDLIHYQDLSQTTVTKSVVALQDFRGRYGDLRTDVWKLRVSASMPLYIDRVNPIPYVVLSTTFHAAPKISPGLLFNVLTNAINRQKYIFPSTLGVGIDWVDKKINKPNLFLRGAISIGAFK